MKTRRHPTLSLPPPNQPLSPTTHRTHIAPSAAPSSLSPSWRPPSPPGIVLVRDVEFAATSADSLLPFYGRLALAYAPGPTGVVLGLSKVARLAKLFSRRLTTQAAFTADVLAALDSSVSPAGAAILVEAVHLAQGPAARTVVMSGTCGSFAGRGGGGSDVAEFLALLRIGGPGDENATVRRGRSWPPPPATTTPGGGASAASTRPPSPATAPATSSPVRAAAAACCGSAAPPSTHRHSYSPRASMDGDADDCATSHVHGGEIAAANRAAAALLHLPRPGRAVPPTTRAAMEDAVRALLIEVGEDPSRPGLRGAPECYVAFLLASTAGYSTPLPQEANTISAAAGADDDIPFSSTLPDYEATLRFTSQCEHHMLPFHGTARIAVTGPVKHLSRPALEDIVAAASHRLQVQERLTAQIADSVAAATAAASVLVVCDAAHLCMVSRGVEKAASSTVTLAARGGAAGGASARRGALAAWGRR